MSLHRVVALAERIITQFRRDRRTLGLLFIVPTVVLTLFAYVFRLETQKIPLGIVEETMTAGEALTGPLPLARRLLRELEDTGDFEMKELRRYEVEPYLRQGKVKAVLIFPEHYSRRALLGRRLSVDLLLEGSQPQTSSKVLSRLAAAFPAALLRFTSSAEGAANLEDSGSREIRVDYFYGSKDFDDLDYFAPVFIAFFALFFVFLLTTVSFLRERSQGTMERLLATPVTRAEIVLGYMAGFGFFALIQSLVVVALAIFALGIHYVGNPLVIVLVVVILTLGGVNLGIFLSAFARTELQAVQFIPLVIVPQVFLSGFIWALEDMPQWLQAFGYIMPLTYANRALRDVMLKGFGLGEGTVGWDLVALVIFATVMAFLASITLRREVA